MNIQQIPIEQLIRSSAHNVRKSGGKSITELAASIRAHGKKAGEAVGKCKGKAAIVAAAAQQLDPSGPGGKVWLPEPLREPAPKKTKAAKVAKTAKAAVASAARKKRDSQEEE